MNSLLGIAAYGPLGFMGYGGGMGALGESAPIQPSKAEVTSTVVDMISGSTLAQLNQIKRGIMEQYARIGAQKLQIDAMPFSAARERASQEWLNARAANKRASEIYDKGAEQYNELRGWIYKFSLGFYNPSSADRMSVLSGLGVEPVSLSIGAIIALILASTAALTAIGWIIYAIRAAPAEMAKGDSWHTDAQKTITSLTDLPKKIGEGALDFGKGIREASTGLMQLAVAAAIGYGIYLLVKKGRRSAGATAPTTALALPDLKTVEGTVIS